MDLRLDGLTGRLPGGPASGQGPCARPSRPPKLSRHTGARGFVRSSTEHGQHRLAREIEAPRVGNRGLW